MRRLLVSIFLLLCSLYVTHAQLPPGQLQQQQQRQLSAGQQYPLQEQTRQILAAKEPEESAVKAAAAPSGSAPDPFANFTVGNATAARENALKKALLENYNRGSFPWAEYGPATVKLNVALHKILGVDLHGGTLRLAVWMRQEWWDPRLTWDAKQWNVTKLWFSNPQQGDTEIWEPDVALWNAATPILYTLSQHPLGVRSDGRVNWGRPGVFEAACNFKGLSAYPFGRVRCQLELGSWTYGPWYVNVTLQGKGYDIGGSVTSGESAVWTEYKIQNVKAHRHTYPPYPCCPDESDWPVMLVDLALERQNLIYMMKVIVPQIILTAVAFSTFWLSPACGERLGLAVTVPLAVAVYDLLTFSQLPVSNKVTLVSALGMTAFLFSMAVLLENAFVIQLWHYTEHTYFKGASVLAATAVAYREQLVWVQLLGCIHQLKFEVARRQLSMLEGKRSTTPKSPRDRSFRGRSTKTLASFTRWHEAVTQTHQTTKTLTRLPTPPASRDNRDRQMLCTELSSQQQGQHRGMNGGVISSCCSKDLADVADDASLGACGDVPGVQQDAERTSTGTAAATAAYQRNSSSKPSAGDADGRPAVADAAGGTVDGVECQAGTAGSTAPQWPGWPVLGRARKQVFVQLGELEAQLGVGEGKDATTDALLLSCTTREQLRAHLNNILTSRDKNLIDIQRRIQKAFLVFGEDVVCSRLQAVLAGDAGGKQPGPGSPHGVSPSDADQPPAVSAAEPSEASPHSLQSRLNGEFNRRWQLLSMMIDHVCRYLFIFAYVGSMVAIIVALLNNDDK